MKIRPHFDKHDWWIGFFWSKKYRVLYFHVLCVGLKFIAGPKRDARGQFDADSNPHN